MTPIRPASLLMVVAHPDDELFHGGVLAHLSRCGVRVTLVCATDGEAGKPHPSVGPVEDLGALRIEELRLSCERLGIEAPVLLRFHDSARKERQRHDDPHALANVDMAMMPSSAVRELLEVIAARFRSLLGNRRSMPSSNAALLLERRSVSSRASNR